MLIDQLLRNRDIARGMFLADRFGIAVFELATDIAAADEVRCAVIVDRDAAASHNSEDRECHKA